MEFLLDKIASSAPAPASGSAAAAVVAASAALLQKAALRSEKIWPGAAAANATAEALRFRAEELIEQDSIAYLDFVAAVRSGDDAGAARDRTIEVPLEIVRSACEAVALAGELADHGNPNLRADAVVAAVLANAAAQAAAILIGINLGDAPRDTRPREAARLVRAASARARRLAVPSPSGGRDHARGRSSSIRRQ
jgi:formiminotetrahydrofolate cyclodeaminase